MSCRLSPGEPPRPDERCHAVTRGVVAGSDRSGDHLDRAVAVALGRGSHGSSHASALAALVVAALGTVLVFLYANNAQNAAQEGQTLVRVLVAKSKIEVGTTGSAASANGAFEVASDEPRMPCAIT